MKIFISWSKQLSMELAIKTKLLLEELDSQITAFVSEIDIIGGEDVQKKIIEKIEECDKLIICFTKENKKAPWLLFEAGFARGLKRPVIPMLFDEDPTWHSWIDNPMNIAREIKFYSDNFYTELITCFNIKNTKVNKKKVDNYKESIFNIKQTHRKIDVQCEDIVEKLVHNDTFVIENPYFRNSIGYFLSGFESFELLKIIIDSFLYTGKYLWIYGRRNMKLFSGNYTYFFKYMHEKASCNDSNMDGIDFRCLFLDPNSPNVKTAHAQQHIFKSELNATLLRAKDVVGGNNRLRECFRMYSNKREAIIIRIDECIIYSRPVFDENGFPQLLTNTGFEIFGTSSKKGIECLRQFESVWDSSKIMPENFGVDC